MRIKRCASKTIHHMSINCYSSFILIQCDGSTEHSSYNFAITIFTYLWCSQVRSFTYRCTHITFERMLLQSNIWVCDLTMGWNNAIFCKHWDEFVYVFVSSVRRYPVPFMVLMECLWLCWWVCSALLVNGIGGYCCLSVLVELQRKKIFHTHIKFNFCLYTSMNTHELTLNTPFQTLKGPFLSCLRTFLWSGLAPILDRWDLPVSVFPFNMVILLYLACTGTSNPYFPNYPALQPGAPESTNHTQLHVSQVRE